MGCCYMRLAACAFKIRLNFVIAGNSLHAPEDTHVKQKCKQKAYLLALRFIHPEMQALATKSRDTPTHTHTLFLFFFLQKYRQLTTQMTHGIISLLAHSQHAI